MSKRNAGNVLSEYKEGIKGMALALAVAGVLAFSGCSTSEGSEAESPDNSGEDTSMMIVVDEGDTKFSGESWKILADRETGVEYIQHRNGYGKYAVESMSVRLDADGKPIICEDVLNGELG